MNTKEKIFICVFAVILMIVIVIAVTVGKKDNGIKDGKSDTVGYSGETLPEITEVPTATEWIPDYVTEASKVTEQPTEEPKTEYIPEYVGNPDYWYYAFLNMDSTPLTDVGILKKTLVGNLLSNISDCPTTSDNFKKTNKNGFSYDKYGNFIVDINTDEQTAVVTLYDTDKDSTEKGVTITLKYTIVNDLLESIEILSTEDYLKEYKPESQIDTTWAVSFYTEEGFSEGNFIWYLVNNLDKLDTCPYIQEGYEVQDFSQYQFSDCDIDTANNIIILADGTKFAYDYTQEPLKLTKLELVIE